MSRHVFRSLVRFGVALALFLGLTVQASAMTVTSTGESGCSLRAAIQAVAANDSGTSCGGVVSGGPTPINLAANTYTPFDGQILVPAGTNVEINGDNVNNPLTTVIDGTGGTLGRIFEIQSGAAVKLSGLQVTGGRTPDAAPSTNIHTYNPVGAGGAILNQGSLTLDHVVVSGNRTGDGSAGAPPAPEGPGGAGGPGGNGGAIYNADYASLTITDSEIRDNLTGNGGNGGPGANGVGALGHNGAGNAGGNGAYGGNGGGIFNSNFGSVSIDKSTISGNDVGRGGTGGAGGQGAGPFTPDGSTSEFSGSTGGYGGDGGNSGKQYRKDQAQYTDEALGGGGVYNLGSIAITNSTISGNTTGAGGNGGPSGPGGLQSTGSDTFQVSGLAGSGGGGGRGAGLLNASWHQGSMNLTNVTIFGNLTGAGGNGGGGAGGAANTLGGGAGGYGGDGGGIWTQGSHDQVLQMTFVTVAGNFPGVGGTVGSSADPDSHGPPGGRGVGAGIAVGNRYNPGGAGVYLKNSVIANNGFPASGDGNCVQHQPIENYTEISDQGNNLTYPGGSICPGTVDDPELSPLGGYGGPTETMVPAPGSPAIGGVPIASCNVPNDQRGRARPGEDGASCDIGAVETGAADALTPTSIQVVSSAQPSKAGQPVTFTATVSPPPSSGTVGFKDGGTTIGGCAATALKQGGKFTCPVTYGSAGTHTITATYSGNTLFAASTSPALTQTVNSDTQPPPKTARLGRVTVSGPSATKKGGSPKFKVRITNVGNAAASGVRLKVSGGGANLSKTVGGIPAGGAKTVRVRVRLKKTGHKTLTFKVTSANAGSGKASKTVTVRRPRRRHHH